MEAVVERRVTVEDLVAVDVRRLAKLRYLDGGRHYWGVQRRDELLAAFSVTAGDSTVELRDLLDNTTTIVELTSSESTYGRRTWWSCPTCGRRCAKLLVMAGLRCIECSELPHQSTVLSHRNRVRLRRELAARRCGASLVTGDVTRPPHMRRVRWERLVAQWQEAELAFRAELGAEIRAAEKAFRAHVT